MVDDDDFDHLSKWNWYAQKTHRGFYAARRDGTRLIYMHRELNKTPNGMLTDHEDCNKLNNQRKNLRTATALQNTMNARPQIGRASRLKGVVLDDKGHNRAIWKACISINGKHKNLGRFNTEIEAHNAYVAACETHFGEYGRTEE